MDMDMEKLLEEIDFIKEFWNEHGKKLASLSTPALGAIIGGMVDAHEALEIEEGFNSVEFFRGMASVSKEVHEQYGRMKKVD